MKLWRKLGNKLIVEFEGENYKLTGRQVKQHMKTLESKQKPASSLMLALMKRI